MKRFYHISSILFFILTLFASAQTLTLDSIPLVTPQCGDGIIPHQLDHLTTSNQDPVRMFSSNGSGVAVNDIDHNGYIDIAFANIGGTASLLLNQGNFEFDKIIIQPDIPTRAISIVDINGDSQLDMVFTTQLGSLLYWQNTGDVSDIELQPLPGVTEYAYSMAWGDADKDGDLDLVTASYDSELNQLLGDTFLFGDGAGVFYYENTPDGFISTRLSDESHGLVTYLHDINRDGQLDLFVGNDFGLQDEFWTFQAGVWIQTTPFTTITHSTMSFDSADVNNDGTYELFSTDMKPYLQTQAVEEAWQPVMAMMHEMPEDDPQVMENVLQVADSGDFVNLGSAFGLDATGWSWSAQFGDLDSDGFQDLYVTNGMIAEELFGHLPNNELVEENQAFRNEAGQGFIPMPEWGLNATASGRGMVMADLDNDGDLDIVVNNLLSPSVAYENQLCGRSIQIELHDSTSPNSYALGAEITLITDIATYTRQLQAVSGYLSGNSLRVHFGIPDSAQVQSIDVRWTDGTLTTLAIPDAQSVHYYIVSR